MKIPLNQEKIFEPSINNGLKQRKKKNREKRADLMEKNEFQIYWKEYPLSIISRHSSLKNEFDSIINEKHESDYIMESANNYTRLIIRRRNVSKSKRFNFENWKSRLSNDLDRFRDKHFETYEANQSDMTKAMWKELNTLINNYEYSKLFLISEEKVGKWKKIEIYGLKNDIESIRSKLEENEKKRNKNIVKELKRLSEWQTKYFERFVDYKQIIDEIDDNLKVEISGKKISIYGERNSVEEAYDEIEQVIDSIQRIDLEIEPRSLVEYFILSDLSKLNQLVEDNELNIMLNKSGESIHMIGRNESDFEELKELITSQFSSQEYIIDKSLIDLVRSRKFEESVEKKQIELNIPEEERKSMIRITDREIIWTGETHLVDELLIHFNAYLDGNRIMSCDYTNRYPLEILKYFERVVLEGLEKELNKDIVDHELQMKQILEINSSLNSPRLRINVPFKHSYLVRKYLYILDNFVYYSIEEDYSIHNKFPLLQLVDQKHILEAIKSIENRNRCVISLNTEEKDQSEDCNFVRCRLEAASIGQLNLIDYDYIVNVNVDNENLDGIAMKFFVDFQNFMFRPSEKSHRKIVIFFNKTRLFESFSCRNLILSKILDLLSGLSVLENLDLIAFACEQAEFIQPILYNHFLNKSRYTFQKTALISYPIGNIQPSFYTGENLLTGICKNCLKFTIRSYNKVCIERCKFELNQTVNKLFELIITGVRCYPWFDGSNIDLIMQVEQICSNNRVIYEWDFEKQSISVTGKFENLSEALSEIDKSVREFNTRKQAYEYVDEISQSVQWQVFRNDQWQAFNVFLNVQLEMKYKKRGQNAAKIRLLDEQNLFFEADLQTYKLWYDIDLGLRHYQMRRVELKKSSLLTDVYWTSTRNFEVVRLDPNSLLFNEKLSVFLSMGLNYRNILSIDRIENRYLYTQYISCKDLIRDKYNLDTLPEYNLFHGTNGDCVESICRYGFNRSYAGKNASVFGKGVYFACLASYSHRFTDIVKRGQPVGHMFLCRVLVGSWTLGDPSMTVPPNNFDSTTDDPSNPSMYVIYKDAQAYPDYLITYQ